MALSAPQAAVQLRSDVDGIAPERAIVFEVAGSLSDFYSQTRRISLNFLLECDIDFEPDDDFHVISKSGRTEAAVGGRLYMAMPDVRALREILRLWDLYRQGRPLGHGFTPWRTLFDLLKNVRAWGPQDRVLPETIEYWKERVTSHPDANVRFEVELWYNDIPSKRPIAQRIVEENIGELGGRVVSAALIEDIRYHGLLVDLPAYRARELILHPDATIGRLDEIMYLRPQSVAVVPEPDGEPEVYEEKVAPLPANNPIAALLDGVPIANHQLLLDRIIFDDPENFSSRTLVQHRAHGTSMASLIIHGDLLTKEAAISRPLYVQPVMIYDAEQEAESTPPDRLPLHVIYLAVERMFRANASRPASAPSVVVVNLSLGDMNRPFSGSISPWARLLDWLALHHRVLFLVSAGNITEWLPLRGFPKLQDFTAATPDQQRASILESLNSEKSRRSLLSPAEGLNSITVGAWHADNFLPTREPLGVIDPFPDRNFPNLTSAVGLGFRRTVKPDLLFDGGRGLIRAKEDDGHVWLQVIGGGPYTGQLAAAPDPQPTGRLDYQRRTMGTSNATALLTRATVRIYDGLLEAGYDIPRSHTAVLLKALLVHGAAWGEAGETLDAAFGPAGRAWQKHRDNISRFLGYGRPNIERVLECSRERATLFAFGDIREDSQDEFDIPLPPSMEGTTEVRRLTMTLAWLTPINTRHQQYRAATLEVLPNGDKKYSLAVDSLKAQPTSAAINRGTLSHCIFEGESAVAFLDGGFLKVRVACRAQAGKLDRSVPYALAVSLETAIGSEIAVYDEVRAAIQPSVRATSGRNAAG